MRLFIIVVATILFAGTCNAQRVDQVGRFKDSNGVLIWQNVYESDLPIESIKQTAMPKKLGWYGGSADIVVEKKDGRTRVTILNFTPRGESSVGVPVAGILVSSTDSYGFNEMFIKRKGGLKNGMMSKLIRFDKVLVDFIASYKSDLSTDW